MPGASEPGEKPACVAGGELVVALLSLSPLSLSALPLAVVAPPSS